MKQAAQGECRVPFDLAIRHTLEFVRHALPVGPRRLLEVGCGNGYLASRLQQEGHRVVGVDLAAEQVQVARAAGLDVRLADFLTFEEEPFDAVLFTRSLHHVSGLSEAVNRAWHLLAPDGLVVAEEFDVENVDRLTAAWFYDLQAILVAAEALLHDPPNGPADPLERWRWEHREHTPLHTGDALVAAVGRHFDLLSIARPPYLYRYFCGKLPDRAAAFPLACRIFVTEQRHITDCTLRPIGLRMVARKRLAAD